MMLNAKYLILGSLLSFLSVCDVAAAGLDEIYRDLVRSDNRGYLPLFVKNRQAPNILDEGFIAGDVSKPKIIDEQNLKNFEDINLVNERQRISAERDAVELRWQQVLKNVQNGYVSSIELEELTKREKDNNPQAIDVLGWIYARGVGVDMDLIKAFNYYKKGASLKVPNATENAVKVYKAMSPEEKTRLLDN